MVPLCLNAVMYLIDTVFIHSIDEKSLQDETARKNSLLDLFSLTSELTESGVDTISQSDI